MRDGGRFWVIVGLLVAAGAGGFLWLRGSEPPAPPPAPTAPPPAPPPPPPPDASAPAIRHPIERAEDDRGEPSQQDPDAYFERVFADLLGRKAVRSFLNLDGFARRFVATVDNLATPLAAPQMWPLKATAGRLVVEPQGEGEAIAAKNSERYAPALELLLAVDTQRAVRVYRRAYPLFQQAYEDLGYPGKYFNDRLIEVIDHLVATPTASGPLAVKRLQVEGAATPSNVYVFEDPALERGSAGQKILLRMGPQHAERVKRKLAEVRALIAR